MLEGLEGQSTDVEVTQTFVIEGRYCQPQAGGAEGRTMPPTAG